MKCPQCGRMVFHDPYTNTWVDGNDRVWMGSDECGFTGLTSEWRKDGLASEVKESHSHTRARP